MNLQDLNITGKKLEKLKKKEIKKCLQKRNKSIKMK